LWFLVRLNVLKSKYLNPKHLKKEFTLNIILLVIINLLVKPLYIFGVEARFQNLIGIEQYGLYFEYFGFVLIFQFLNDPGIQNWYAQFLPKNKEKVSSELSDVISLKIVTSLIYLAFVLVLAWIMNYQQPYIIFLLAVNLILSTFFLFLRINISGLGYYRIDSFISSIDKLLMIAIIGYLAWWSPYQYEFTIKTFVYGQMASYGIACLVAAIIVINKVPKWAFGFNISKFAPILKKSFPYLITLMVMTFYNRIDGVLLGRMIDDFNYQAGVYASVYRFYDASNMVSYLFAALLLPMYASQYHDFDRLKELVLLGLKYIIVSSTIIVMTLSFYGDIFMQLLLNDYTDSFLGILRLMMLSFIFVSLGYVFGTLMVAADKIKSLNLVFIIGLVVNLSLNVVLIPMYGAVGAAVTAVITQLVVLIGQIYLVKKEIGIRVPRAQGGILLLFFGLCGGIFFVIKNIKIIEWYYALGVSIFICVLLSFILKIVDSGDLSFFNKKGSQ